MILWVIRVAASKVFLCVRRTVSVTVENRVAGVGQS